MAILPVHFLTLFLSRHYFFGATRDDELDNVKLNERTRALRSQISSTEDEPMIRAQQERMSGSDFWAHKPLLLAIAKGAGRGRRKLESLIAHEQRSFRTKTFLPDPERSGRLSGS